MTKRIAAGVSILCVLVIVGILVVSRTSSGTAPAPPLGAACGTRTTVSASLFGGDVATAIRISGANPGTWQTLRTEPAKVLPAMFDALLAVSPDSKRLEYVTARNELMDDAHLYSIDVASPDQRHDLATVATGLWPIRPAWSQDGSRVAYVTAADDSASVFQVWSADPATGRASVLEELPRQAFLPPAQPSLCWTSAGTVTLTAAGPSANLGPLATPTPSGSSTGASSTGTGGGASPTAGGASECGVPVMSQNDPRWRHLFMKYAGDSIGGYGCALTSTAMMLNYFGAGVDVSQLNDCMGTNADPLYWGVAPKCSDGKVSGGGLTPFAWSKLDTTLAGGNPEIVGVVRGQNGSHFVVVTSGGGDVADAYHITDPWDGTTDKTLGYYTARGYNLDWLVPYAGATHNCGRLADDLGLHVSGVTDGGDYQGTVTVDPGSDGRYAAPPILVDLGGGPDSMPTPSPSPSTVPTASASGGGSGSATLTLPPYLFTLPPLVALTPFQQIPPGGLTVTHEGIFELILQLAVHPGDVRLVTIKFTVDHTAPQVGVNFLNPVNGSFAALRPASASHVSDAVRPVDAVVALQRPGRLTVPHVDPLSGVREVDYSLDGAPMQPYTDVVNDLRTLTVDQPGPHTITVQGTDLAGNLSDATTRQFVVVDQGADVGPLASPTPSPSPSATATASPSPSPTPRPSPTPTPTSRPTPTPTPCPPLASPAISATYTYDAATGLGTVKATWSSTGGCQVKAALSATYGRNPQPSPLGTYNGNSGTYSATFKNCTYPYMRFSVTFTDQAGETQTATMQQTVTTCS